MAQHRKTASAIALFLAMWAARAFAYNPLPGVALFPILGSAQALGYGPSATALDAPWADRENPAASAAQQRTCLDAGFTALTDFGRTSGPSRASGARAPSACPFRALCGLERRPPSSHTPSTMTDLPFGIALGSLRGGIAKDLFPDFFVGGAVDLTLGDQGWGAGLDLGIMQLLGDHGVLQGSALGRRDLRHRQVLQRRDHPPFDFSRA